MYDFNLAMVRIGILITIFLLSYYNKNKKNNFLFTAIMNKTLLFLLKTFWCTYTIYNVASVDIPVIKLCLVTI